MGFKIFDSHVRDLYGRGQPQGTCVLLEVLSLDSLVHYFQSIHNNDIFEVRVQIENIKNRMVSQNSLNETINFNLMPCSHQFKQVSLNVVFLNMVL